MASSSKLNLLSSEADKKKLFTAAAEVTHNSEEHFLENVERKGRQSLGKRFTTLKVSTIEDPRGSEKRIINEASSKEYAFNEIEKAAQEHEYVVPMPIYQFAALNPKGCLLNKRGQFSTTGQVLVVVLSFVLIQLWEQGYTNITSISIVVGNVLENRQDNNGGLNEHIHIIFWPFRGKNSHYGLGELQNNQAHSDAFFSEGCRLIISSLQNIGVPVTFLTSKATFAARANGVILPLKDQKTQNSNVYRYGHTSNRRNNGRDSTQAFSGTVLTAVGAKKPPPRQGLNYWHSGTESESASQSFSSTITVTAFPLQEATPFKYEISSSFLLGSYEETGGGAESKERMDQRIASARAKREKREREAREKREKREREAQEKREKREREAREKREKREREAQEKREKREREAQEKRERAEEERRLKREKKEAEQQQEEAIAEAKRIEIEEIEAAKLDFRIDAEKFSDTNDLKIIEALNEARGDLDTIDQELATLDANTEGLNYKENSEKCGELETVRQEILYRCSELLSVVDENTRQRKRSQKKRALDRKEEKKKKKTSSLLDLL